MKKKIMMIASALFVTTVMGAYAEFGIGVQGNYGWWGGGWGGALLLSPKDTVHFAISGALSDKYLTFGISGDLWALNLPLISGNGELKFYVGPGLYANVGMWDKYLQLGMGFRLPIGLDFKIQQIDIFLQLVPAVGVWMAFEDELHFVFPSLYGWGGNIGIRFWL